MKSFRIWWGKKIGREPGYLLSWIVGIQLGKWKRRTQTSWVREFVPCRTRSQEIVFEPHFVRIKKKNMLFFVRPESPDLQTVCPLNIDGPIRNQSKNHPIFLKRNIIVHPPPWLFLFQPFIFATKHQAEAVSGTSSTSSWVTLSSSARSTSCWCFLLLLKALAIFCSYQLKMQLYSKILNATTAMPLSKDGMFFQRSICMYFLLLDINLLKDICCIVHVPFYCQTICVVIELLRLQLLRVCFMYRSCPVLSGPDFRRV